MSPSHYLKTPLFDAFPHLSSFISWPTFSGMSLKMKKKISMKITHKAKSLNIRMGS